MTTPPVFPDVPPDPDTCLCWHPRHAHAEDENGNATRGCTWSSYGAPCYCKRYRNQAAIKRARREEKFWSSVGNHTW